MKSGGVNRQFRSQFIAEAEEHLLAVESGLMALEKDLENSKAVQEILRSLHSLKGISGVILSLIDQDATKEPHFLNGFRTLTHLSESMVQRIRDNPQNGQKHIPLLFRALDELIGLLNVYRQDKSGPMNYFSLVSEMQTHLDLNSLPGFGLPAKPVQLTVYAAVIEQNIQLLEAGLDQFEHGNDHLMAEKLCLRGLRALKNAAKKAENSRLALLVDECDAFFRVNQNERLDFPLLEFGAKIAEMRAESVQAATKAPAPALDSASNLKETTVSVAESAERTIRLAQDKVDEFMNLTGELKIQSHALQAIMSEMEQDLADNRHTLRLKPVADALSRLSQDLADRIMSVRLLPLRLVFSRYHRLVRDLSKNLSKEIRLDLSGEETVIDKNIIEKLYDPLTHMVRNAVDHGIEGPEERILRGKTGQGRIELRAYNRGQRVVIEIIDDGRGLDAVKIRHKALEKGICDFKQLEVMNEQQLYQLLFTPGFSMSDTVNEISGRGVGLDVVRTNVLQIGGSIEIESQPGKGTRFSIQLPLTMAVGRGLLVESRGQMFYLPIDLILETMPLDPTTVFPYKGREAIVVHETLFRAFRLNCLLGGADPDSGSEKSSEEGRTGHNRVLILELNKNKLALIVDACYQEAEYVIKPLQGLVHHMDGFSGAMITAEGAVILLLDIAALLARFEGQELEAGLPRPVCITE